MDNMPMTKMKVGMTNEIFVDDSDLPNENDEESESHNIAQQYLPIGSNSVNSTATRGFSC